MSLKTIYAFAILFAAAAWLAGAAAQTPPAAQQNQANRARPATQGAVDDLRDELARTNRELAALAQAVGQIAQRLDETQDSVAEIRTRTRQINEGLAESAGRIVQTAERLGEVATRLAAVQDDARSALVSVAVSPGAGTPSQAFRDAAAQTCEAMAGSAMTSEVFYAQSGASIGTSQVVCRLRPR